MLPSDLTLSLWSAVLQAIYALGLHSTGQMSMAEYKEYLNMTRQLLAKIDELIDKERKAHSNT